MKSVTVTGLCSSWLIHVHSFTKRRNLMQIYVNNKPVATEATNLAMLAHELTLPERGVAVAVNNKMVPRLQWE